MNIPAGSGREREREDESSPSSLLPRIRLPGHGHRSRHQGQGQVDEKEKEGPNVGAGGRGGHRYTRSDVLGLGRGHGHGHLGLGSGAKRENADSGVNNGTDGGDGLLHPGVAGVKNNMLTRISTNLSSRSPYTHPHATQRAKHQYNISDGYRGGYAALAGGSGARPDLRRRATSDPKIPVQRLRNGHDYGRGGVNADFAGYGRGGGALNAHGQFPVQPAQAVTEQETKPMTEIELLLYKAERARKEADANVTEASVQKLTTQLAESNVELQERLAGSNRTASDLMRRLDDAHHSLSSTASSLVDTISSFQNLVTQSQSLIENFEHREKELDRSTRHTLQKRRRELFDDKGEQVQTLEERSRKANEKAEELSRRLENCRTIVRNYQDREQTKRRAWKGVLVGCFWGASMIVLGLLMGLGLWWYRSYGDIVRHDVQEVIAMALDGGGPGIEVRAGELADMNETERRRVLENVPEDVRGVLQDIADRHGSGDYPGNDMKGSMTQQQYIPPSSEAKVEDDKKLKKLFEKLEL